MRVGAVGGVLTLWVVLLASFTSEGGAQGTRSSDHGSNTCRYANDGECDDEETGTGACLPNTDTSDCERQHSCAYAHDGECDEPGWGAGGRCESGTDSDDCCPPHAHTAANRMQCACNANYHVDRAAQQCRPGSPSPAPASVSRQECDQRCQELEDAEAVELCHDDCQLNDANHNPIVALVVMIALMGILFFPCIVFGIAHTCCIRDQRKDGRQPVPQAWTICTSLFVTALLCTWFPVISILWLILPFCMVAPFCFDQCCKSCAHPPSAVDSLVSRLTSRTVSRVARRGHWRGYAGIQSRGQATGTARSREARADPEG